MHANRVHLAGKPIPKGVTAWSIKNAQGERCAYPQKDGAEAYEFPVCDLSAENIRRAWGPGTYRVTFIVEQGGERRPKGGRTFTVHPVQQPGEPASSASAQPRGVEAAGDPLQRSFQILDAIDRRANAQSDRFLGLVTTMLQSNQQAAAQSTQLDAFGRRIAESLERLEARISDLEAGSETDDDDDDDDRDDDDDDDGGALFKPGEPIADAAIAAAANGIVSLGKDLAPVMKEWVAMKMIELQQEAERRAKAAHLNGAEETRIEVKETPAAVG